jgi:hypothetical protein
MSRHRSLFSRGQSLTASTDSSAVPTGKRRGQREQSRAVREAALHACEQLERRRLFSTWTGGGVASNNPLVPNGTPLESTYSYYDGNNKTVRVALWGNITAEFIFANVDSTTNAVNLTDAVPPPPQKNPPKNYFGADLFSIYIASASPNASISIAELSAASATETSTTLPHEDGFSSSSGNTITVNDATTGKIETASPVADGGGVYIGAVYAPKLTKTRAVIADGIPILTIPLNTQYGVRPPSANGQLYAGIDTATGVSLNRILIGGVVTGRVNLGGSIDTFYAGNIWTGDADGIAIGEAPDQAFASAGVSAVSQLTGLDDNFNVAGDINNLLSLGDIGGSGVDTTGPGQPKFVTGFHLEVGGHLGEVYSADSVDGSFHVDNLSTLKGLGRPQTQELIPGAAPDPTTGESFFEGNAPASDGTTGVPSLNDLAVTGANPFRNDTTATAQFVASPFSSTLGHNAVQITGLLDNTKAAGDDIAYYGVPLGADQTVTATLKLPLADYTGGAPPLELGILAPDAGYNTAGGTTAATSSIDVLASTYYRNLSRDDDKPITFTSGDAGIYYFAVAYLGDTNFAGATGGVATGAFDYELDITGVKNIGLGAVAATNNIGFDSGSTISATGVSTILPSVRVDYGDLGSIISTTGGDIISADAGETADSVRAERGNIRVIQAGSIGVVATGAGTTAFVSQGIDVYALGNVGTLRTTLADTSTASNTGGGATLSGGVLLVNDNITAPGVGTPIGGSYQLVDCAGDLGAGLEADGDIGTVRANDIGFDGYSGVFQVDANGKSGAGRIDLIDVPGNHFGTLSSGGPKIATGPGGNVGYIHVSPTTLVFNDDFFGGDLDEPIDYAAGQAATLIDDSGIPYTLTPYTGGEVINPGSTTTSSGSTGSGSTGSGSTSTSQPTLTVTTGDAQALLTYGVEDKGGVVLISDILTPGDVTTGESLSGTSNTTGTTTAFAGPTSLTVTSASSGNTGSIDIGQLTLVGNGTTLTFDPLTQTFTTGAGGDGTLPEGLSATFNGNRPVNVYDFLATTPTNTGAPSYLLAGATNVENNTAGEIVNFHAQDVETLRAQTLGIAHSDVDAPVGGATVFADVYPYHNLRTMIQIGGTLSGDGFTTADPTAGTVGDAETIESTGQLGNIISNGTIGTIAADDGVKSLDGAAGGIVGPILAASPNEFETRATSDLSGNILNVNVGDGLGYSGSGNDAITGIFADNYIGTVSNQNGSDIRGDIVSNGDAGGLTAPEIISTITGNVIPSKVTHGLFINQIDVGGGGSIVDANIYTTTTAIQASQPYVESTTGYVIQSAGATVNPNPANADFGIGSIAVSGTGGIIGSDFLNAGIGSIGVSGFGIITSEFSTINASVIGNISAAGYGIRSSSIVGQNSVESITAEGNGKELAVTNFPASVRQSESGSTTDIFSGQPIDAYDDLDMFLGTSAAKPKRRNATERGVIADVDITGTQSLGSLTAWRLVGNTAQTATTPAQRFAALTAPAVGTTLSFASHIGSIKITESTSGAHITTGSLNSFSTGMNLSKTIFNVAGEIKSLTAGFISGGSHINATGPDGVIDYLATTGGNNGNINATVDIGEILVGGDLDSINLSSGGNLNELLVQGNVDSQASVFVDRTLGKLLIKRNLLGGSVIQARAITTKSIGGATNGNIIITTH